MTKDGKITLKKNTNNLPSLSAAINDTLTEQNQINVAQLLYTKGMNELALQNDQNNHIIIVDNFIYALELFQQSDPFFHDYIHVATLLKLVEMLDYIEFDLGDEIIALFHHWVTIQTRVTPDDRLRDKLAEYYLMIIDTFSLRQNHNAVYQYTKLALDQFIDRDHNLDIPIHRASVTMLMKAITKFSHIDDRQEAIELFYSSLDKICEYTNNTNENYDRNLLIKTAHATCIIGKILASSIASILPHKAEINAVELLQISLKFFAIVDPEFKEYYHGHALSTIVSMLENIGIYNVPKISDTIIKTFEHHSPQSLARDSYLYYTMINTYSKIAMHLHQNARDNEAYVYIKQSLILSKPIDYTLSCYQHTSNFSILLGILDKIIDDNTIQEVNAFIPTNKTQSPQLNCAIANNLHIISVYLFHTQQYEETYEHINKCLSFFEDDMCSPLHMRALVNIAILIDYIDDEYSNNILETLYNHLHKIDYTLFNTAQQLEIAKMFNTIGICLSKHHNYTEAVEYLQSALSLNVIDDDFKQTTLDNLHQALKVTSSHDYYEL